MIIRIHTDRFPAYDYLIITYKKYQIWLPSYKSSASMQCVTKCTIWVCVAEPVYQVEVYWGWRTKVKTHWVYLNQLPTTTWQRKHFKDLMVCQVQNIYMEMSMILSILFCIFHLFWVRNVLTFYQLCIYVIAWLCLAAAIP